MKSMRQLQLILFIAFFVRVTHALAVCEIKTPPTTIDFSYSRLEAFDVNATDSYKINARSSQLNYQGKSWLAGHEYNAFNYPGNNLSTPVTNGHLHSVVVGYTNTSHSYKPYNLYWELLPTLAVSSNQLKNSNEIGASSFRLDGHLIWKGSVASGGAVFAGGCATAVTGDHKIIPVIGILYQNPSWKISFAFPHSELEYTQSPTISVYSAWAISGNQWEVLDKNLENRGDFHLTSKQLKLGLRFNFASFGIIQADWLHYYDQEMVYFARNNRWISVDMDNTQAWMLRYIYLL